MGVVVAAMHVELHQRVALKFLLPHALGFPDLVERFAREARAAAKIQSEHVARVIDVGSLETGAPYMVMEYLDGQDLQQVLASSGRLPVEAAVGYVLHACEAIAEAHAAGIVHRDLKPANLFLAARPNGSAIVKVLDFGISKSTMATTESGLTETSTMMGSPSYMAPEQIRAAKSVDARADQWSLGVILYELITAVKPFRAESMAAMVWVILDQPHAKVSTLVPELPAPLEAAMDRCLAKDPAQRFANVAELAAAIAPYGPAWSATSVKHTAHALGVGASVGSAEASPSAPPALAATPAAGPRPLTDEEAAMTGAPWSSSSAGTPRVTNPPVKSRSPRVVPLAALGLVAGALVAGMAVTRGFMGTRAAPGSPSAGLAPPERAASAASESAVSPPVPVPPSTAEPIADPGPVPTSATTAPRAVSSADPVTPRPRSTSVTTSKPTKAQPAGSASVAPAPKCTTVSYFDADGMKHFKQECR
jgi:serine/threonine protein kinase